MINNQDLLVINNSIDKIEKVLKPVGAGKYFWNPCYFEVKADAGKTDTYEGFTLLYNGGYIFGLFCVDNELCVHAFSALYDKYFEDAYANKSGKAVSDIGINFFRIDKQHIKKDNIAKLKDNAQILLNLTKDEWEKIDKALDNWVCCKATKGFETRGYNPNFEKQRAAHIAAANNHLKNNESIEPVNSESMDIASVEFEVKLDPSCGHDNARTDLVGIYSREGKLVISFIEYKCTEKATGGKTSLPEHYEDMKSFYNIPEIKGKVLNMYNNRRLLYGYEPLNYAKEDIETEIVFLFSHVTKEETKDGKYVYAGTLAGKILTMMNHSYKTLTEFDDTDIWYMVLKDYSSDKILAVKDDKKRFALSVVKVGNRNTTERKMHNERIRALFV